jgi:hypothetical protein
MIDYLPYYYQMMKLISVKDRFANQIHLRPNDPLTQRLQEIHR